VLLHPEGAPSWHGEGVGPLVPGVIDMAWEASRASGTEALVAPIVWRLHFRGDVSKPLHRAITHAERLLVELESRHGATEGDRPRRVHALRRAILAERASDPERARDERRALAEVERLGHFTSEHYGAATLSQEQIAESVSQIRLALARKGFREALFGVLPVAVAPRMASIRAREPMVVNAKGTQERGHLLYDLRSRLQKSLDQLGAELEPEVGRYRRPNPFVARQPASQG
jgi:hypothetical protein